MNRLKTIPLTALIILFFSNLVSAGEFYKLYPQWLEYAYYFALAALIFLALIVMFGIFGNLKGGKLGLPWIFMILAFVAMLARTVLGILTIFDLAYFQAVVLAGLDVLFFVLILIGLVLYKVGLE